jgi:hypothetical protein
MNTLSGTPFFESPLECKTIKDKNDCKRLQTHK